MAVPWAHTAVADLVGCAPTFLITDVTAMDLLIIGKAFSGDSIPPFVLVSDGYPPPGFPTHVCDGGSDAGQLCDPYLSRSAYFARFGVDVHEQEVLALIDTKVTSASRKQIWLPITLIVGLSSMVGCSSNSGMGDRGDGGLSDTDHDNGGGFAETSNSGTVDSPDSNASEPSDPQPEEQPVLSDDAVPDFSVVDVNVESSRYEEAVSPRDYLGQISAWYFGHAT